MRELPINQRNKKRKKEMLPHIDLTVSNSDIEFAF